MNNLETIYDQIELQYKHLDEIRKNVTYLTRRMGGFNTYNRFSVSTNDVRALIETYTQFYSTIINHIEFLYERINLQRSRHNLPRQPESTSVVGNFAFINGRYYNIDNVDVNSNQPNDIPGQTGNTQTNDNNSQQSFRDVESGVSTPTALSPVGHTQEDNHSPVSPPRRHFRHQPNRNRNIWGSLRRGISNNSPFGLTNTTNLSDTSFNILMNQATQMAQNRQLVNNQNRTRTPFFENLTNELFRNFSDPVIVAPNQQQIREATTTLNFSEIDNPMNTQCPISLERFRPDTIVTQINHCKHVFLPGSFQTWFSSNVRCPICRYDIRTHVTAQNTDYALNSERNNRPTGTHYTQSSMNLFPTNSPPRVPVDGSFPQTEDTESTQPLIQPLFSSESNEPITSLPSPPGLELTGQSLHIQHPSQLDFINNNVEHGENESSINGNHQTNNDVSNTRLNTIEENNQTSEQGDDDSSDSGEYPSLQGPPQPQPQNTRVPIFRNISPPFLNEDAAEAVENLLSDAVRGILNIESPTRQNESNSNSPQSSPGLGPFVSASSTAAIGANIFNNIMSNNIENVTLDPSSNTIRFDTTLYDVSWNNQL